MILVCGALPDTVLAYTCARLEQMDLDYLFLDELKYPIGYEISWMYDNGRLKGYIKSPSRRIELSDITGAYVRHITPNGAAIIPNATEEEARMIRNEYFHALDYMITILPCVVVNKSASQLSNGSKPYQSLLISQSGWRTPKTLVTNIPNEVKSFFNECEGKIIYKSISGVRSIVQRFKKDDFDKINLVRNCVTQFQEYIEGYDIRVHTVGNNLFATKMISEATDYRYASQEGLSITMEPTKLPAKIEKMCFKLTRNLGLTMAGIDLRRTLDNQYYCFEVNPSPGYSYYELGANQPISESLARLLSGEELPKKVK